VTELLGENSSNQVPDWAARDQVAQGRAAVWLILHLHRWLLAISVALLLLSENNSQGSYYDAWFALYQTAC
jgi:hypothetical protein